MNLKILTLSVLILAVLVSSGCVKNEYTCCIEACEYYNDKLDEMYGKWDEIYNQSYMINPFETMGEVEIKCDEYCKKATELYEGYFYDKEKNECKNPMKQVLDMMPSLGIE